ncbi:MAG: hypothetical protein IPI49_02625 [Myxococcales bacterium]|nr:hypothetical protein [Myxococcales bacterium]
MTRPRKARRRRARSHGALPRRVDGPGPPHRGTRRRQAGFAGGAGRAPRDQQGAPPALAAPARAAARSSKRDKRRNRGNRGPRRRAPRPDAPDAPDAPNEPDDPDALAVTDLPRLYAELLGLGPERWLPAEALPERFTLALPDTGQLLRATCALVKDARAASADAPAPLALAWHLPPGLPLDERETVTGAWDYPPSAKLERLLRHAGVPIGLSNGTHLRLLYAPHGAASGALTFRFADLVTAAGRPLLDALIMLLHARQWFGVAADKQLRSPGRLAPGPGQGHPRPRRAGAGGAAPLARRLRGRAGWRRRQRHRRRQRRAESAAYRDPDRGGDHVHAGLLDLHVAPGLRPYAEDNGLLPHRAPAVRPAPLAPGPA